MVQHFWKILSLNFEKELKEATKGSLFLKILNYLIIFRIYKYIFQYLFKGSTFLQQTFVGGYPKLLRLFHEFFAKLEKRCDLKLDGDFQRQAEKIN